MATSTQPSRSRRLQGEFHVHNRMRSAAAATFAFGGRSAIGARSRLLRADPTQNQQNQLSSLNSLNGQSQENLLGQPSQSQSSPQQSPSLSSLSPQQQPQVTPTATRPRNTSHLPLANLIYRPASPSQNLHGALNPASPAQSLGSTGNGVIYRDPPPEHSS